jgi:hypothetical protein
MKLTKPQRAALTTIAAAGPTGISSPKNSTPGVHAGTRRNLCEMGLVAYEWTATDCTRYWVTEAGRQALAEAGSR